VDDIQLVSGWLKFVRLMRSELEWETRKHFL